MHAGDRLRNEHRVIANPLWVLAIRTVVAHDLVAVGIEQILLRCEIAVHADPVHFAALGHLFLPNDRDVVFRLAGDEAGVAAHACG